jgi:hypothetical protein
MRTLRIIAAALVFSLPLRAEDIRAGTTLQEITRDAQQRLKEWDEEDAREQIAEARYWWLGWIELAASLALGRVLFNPRGMTFTDQGGGLTIRPTPSASPTPNSPAPSSTAARSN